MRKIKEKRRRSSPSPSPLPQREGSEQRDFQKLLEIVDLFYLIISITYLTKQGNLCVYSSPSYFPFVSDCWFGEGVGVWGLLGESRYPLPSLWGRGKGEGLVCSCWVWLPFHKQLDIPSVVAMAVSTEIITLMIVFHFSCFIRQLF